MATEIEREITEAEEKLQKLKELQRQEAATEVESLLDEFELMVEKAGTLCGSSVGEKLSKIDGEQASLYRTRFEEAIFKAYLSVSGKNPNPLVIF
jgi:F0F1-type ATP synthase membrane subunit b/b'